MPFGLNKAAATIQCMMDKLLRPHHNSSDTYIDYIIVYTSNYNKHQEAFWLVLQKLRKAGLKANPRKTVIDKADIWYLGFQVDNRKMQSLVDKDKALETYLLAQTKKQMTVFLGLTNYYQKFVPNFAELAVPLTEMTQAGAPTKVVWMPQAERAFQKVKEVLFQSPSLHTPDFDITFLIQTDASEMAIGAVLTQKEGIEGWLVAYISQTFIF